MKVLTVVGARPQFVKAAAVSRALEQLGERAEEVIVHTGQHFDDNMSEVFFSEMRIPAPRHRLALGGLSHGAMTGRMLEGLEAIMVAEKPDWVLVYGDTNSTLAGALAAAKLHLPVAHVEAGLRSFNRRMPEETNRVVSDHVADLLFAPTDTAVANLRNEGIPDQRIVRTGDVMLDASLFYAAIASERPFPAPSLAGKRYALATVHRAENTDDPKRLEAILTALAELAGSCAVVLPLHPRTRSAVTRNGLDRLLGPLLVMPPVGYLDMVQLEQHAAVIATDSGGVQKEAYFFGVPCVTLRTETEWVELISAGANVLTDPGDVHGIGVAMRSALSAGFERKGALYGDGRAAHAIASRLLRAVDG